jgi:hypothetical protein
MTVSCRPKFISCGHLPYNILCVMCLYTHTESAFNVFSLEAVCLNTKLKETLHGGNRTLTYGAVTIQIAQQIISNLKLRNIKQSFQCMNIMNWAWIVGMVQFVYWLIKTHLTEWFINNPDLNFELYFTLFLESKVLFLDLHHEGKYKLSSTHS